MTTLGTHAEEKQTNNNKHNTETMTTVGTHAEDKQTNNNKHNTETMTTLGTHAEDKQTNKQQQTQHRENDNFRHTRHRTKTNKQINLREN